MAARAGTRQRVSHSLLLRPRLIRRLFLPPFIANDSLLGRSSRLRLGPTRLSAMLAAHILPAFVIVLFRHSTVSFALGKDEPGVPSIVPPEEIICARETASDGRSQFSGAHRQFLTPL